MSQFCPAACSAAGAAEVGSQAGDGKEKPMSRMADVGSERLEARWVG